MAGPPTLPVLKLGPRRAVTLFPQITHVRLVKRVNQEEDGVFMSVCAQTTAAGRKDIFCAGEIKSNEHLYLLYVLINRSYSMLAELQICDLWVDNRGS